MTFREQEQRLREEIGAEQDEGELWGLVLQICELHAASTTKSDEMMERIHDAWAEKLSALKNGNAAA
jgi:hypothetical protein